MCSRFRAQTPTSNGSTLNFSGSFTLGTAGALSGTIALNDMTYYGALAITGGTYAVDPTGRVTISGITPSLTTTPFAVQLYLDGNGNALELGRRRANTGVMGWHTSNRMQQPRSPATMG